MSHLAFCSDLTPQALARLSAIAGEVTLAPGDELFDQDDMVRSIYTVRAGTLKLTRLLADGRSQVLGFPEPGDFLGLEPAGRHGSGCSAITQVNLCRFDRASLEAQYDTVPGLRSRLFELACSELAADREQMVLLGRKNARERLASFLMERGRRRERWGAPAREIVLPMSRADIADYLGLTMETVSRTLSAFKRDGLITLGQQGRVTIHDRDALAELAEGAA